MSKSTLVDYTCISPNRSSPRTHRIDTVTIHCTVGQCTVESLGKYFQSKSIQASCNYCVDKNGHIGLFVDEGDRSWCSSNRDNDNRAITIEVSSDANAPYAVNDKAMNALILLLADICRRNGIRKLLWNGDKSLIGQVERQNMTVHRWFANKECPGEYLYSRMGEIADATNALLGNDRKKEIYQRLLEIANEIRELQNELREL